MKSCFVFLLLVCSFGNAQKIIPLAQNGQSSLRGLSVVSDKIIWVSGSNGTVGRSLDNGIIWKWFIVKGFEKIDFRDIEAFDQVTAVIMGISSPAYILKTIDGGETWKIVYENKMKGMFLDAMEFWNEQSGIVIGDPIDNRFFIQRTFDGGETWKDLPKQNSPLADSGEACFASSGTNVRKLSKDEACFVSGGLRSRLFIRDVKYVIPILQGTESSGANSIAVKNRKTFIVVGGDFTTPAGTEKNCVITHDGGKTWIIPKISPHGYRSCIEYLGHKNWICCGLNGVDYSTDDGYTWNWISSESFHTCRKAKEGKTVFLTGAKGKIAMFNASLHK